MRAYIGSKVVCVLCVCVGKSSLFVVILVLVEKFVLFILPPSES